MTLTLLATALAAPLAQVGDALPGATVTAVDEHPEYHAITLELSEGTELRVEVVATGQGVCSRDGLQLFPRWELLGRASPELEDPHHPAVEALCERLATATLPALAPPGGGGQLGPGSFANQRGKTTDVCNGAPDGPMRPSEMPGGTWGWLTLGALAAGTARQLAAAEPGARRWMRRLGLLTFAMVVLAGPCGLANGALAGFEKLRLAWGVADNSLYGVGLNALHHPLTSWLGRSVDNVLWTHGALAVLSPVLLFALLDQLAGRTPAVLGALAYAVLPLPLRLACTEVSQVPVVALQLAALLGITRFAKEGSTSGAILAALASGAVLHLRPEAATFLVVVPAWIVLLGAPRWRPVGLAALVAAPLAMPRLTEIAARASQLDAVAGHGSRFQALLEAATPSLGVVDRFPFLLTTWSWTPALLSLGVALGLLGVLGKRPAVPPALLIWGLAVWAPVMTKTTPLMDALRFQLPVAPAFCALAGCGLAVFATRRLTVPLGLALLVAGMIRLPVARERFLHQAEARWLLSELELPDDAGVIFYDPAPTRARALGQVMADVTSRTWRPLCSLPESPVVFYSGLSCLAELNPPTPGMPSVCDELASCEHEIEVERTFDEAPDVDLPLDGPQSLSLNRVACRVR